MNLRTTLLEDMKQAMRDRDSLRLNTIRFVLAEIKNVEIDQGELDEGAIMKVIARQLKQINETLKDYEKAGRAQQVAEENQKADILESYLPTQLSDQELMAIIDQIRIESPELQTGKIIKLVLDKTAGSADGSRIARLINQH